MSISDGFIYKNNYIAYNGGIGGANVAGTSIPIANSVSRNPTNAIIEGNIACSNITSLAGGIANSIIKNNTIHNELGNGIYYSQIENNLVIAGYLNPTIASNSYFTGSSFLNNVSLSSNNNALNYFPTGNGNQNNAGFANYFGAKYLANAFNIPDSDFQLIPNSIGFTAAVDGGQVGAFGGLTPYKLSGLPAIPIFTNISASSVGNSTTPLNVNITVRGNN